MIPKYASAGAAIGTLVAEIAVWIVQYTYLRKQIKDIYKNVRYGVLILALFLGSIASLWVKKVFSGSFIVLLISAILFFGAYFVVLTIAKEPLIYQIEEGLLDLYQLHQEKLDLVVKFLEVNNLRLVVCRSVLNFKMHFNDVKQ